jgi:hypothetical protein
MSRLLKAQDYWLAGFLLFTCNRLLFRTMESISLPSSPTSIEDLWSFSKSHYPWRTLLLHPLFHNMIALDNHPLSTADLSDLASFGLISWKYENLWVNSACFSPGLCANIVPGFSMSRIDYTLRDAFHFVLLILLFATVPILTSLNV